MVESTNWAVMRSSLRTKPAAADAATIIGVAARPCTQPAMRGLSPWAPFSTRPPPASSAMPSTRRHGAKKEQRPTSAASPNSSAFFGVAATLNIMAPVNEGSSTHASAKESAGSPSRWEHSLARARAETISSRSSRASSADASTASSSSSCASERSVSGLSTCSGRAARAPGRLKENDRAVFDATGSMVRGSK